MERNNRIAVLHIIKGHEEPFIIVDGRAIPRDPIINFHISVPYVSIYKNYDYPYWNSPVSKNEIYNLTSSKHDENIQPYKPISVKRITGDESSIDLFHHPENFLSDEQNINTNEKEVINTIEKELIYDFAKKMTRLYRLDFISDYLFALKGRIDLIQIFTNDIFTPWDWIYYEHKGVKKILSEVFGVGVTFATRNPVKKHHLPLTIPQLLSNKNTALIISNDSSDMPSLQLKDLNEELIPFVKKIKSIFGYGSTVHLENPTLTDITDNIIKLSPTLKFIYIIGHFSEKNGFILREGYNMDSSFIDYLNRFTKHREGFFSNHPIVILNGCKTITAGENNPDDPNDPNAQFPLAQNLLTLGACACIVTSVDMALNYAVPFSKHFFHYLFKPGMAVGEALKKTRLDLAKQNFYEWASYHLLGDPAFTLIRKEK
jgi:CHAT domain